MSEKKTYRMVDLEGFENLVIEGERSSFFNLFGITKITNTNVVVGDRSLSFELPWGALYVHADHLKEQEPPPREFAKDNPLGEYISEGELKRGSLKITYVSYSRAVSVDISEKLLNGQTHTIYSQYFYGKRQREDVLLALNPADVDSLDVEEIVFKLREIKENDKNG